MSEARLELARKLVDDAVASSDLPITSEQRAELDDRLREDDRDPDRAIPWHEARARLHRRR